MKVFKSLLLGSAAGLVAVVGASAADLGVKKPTPVEYVRVCSIIPGHTGFVIPGTDICLRVGGRVRTDIIYNERFRRADDTISLFTRGQIEFHAVSQTEFGPLQAFIRHQFNVTNGATSTALDAGFINWAGFTVGRAPSFYDFTGGHIFGTTVFGDVNPVNVWAYTANFGGGFTASIAVEDAVQTRDASGPVGITPAGTVGFIYGGQRLPDIVANVRVDQSWGSAMLSAGVRQLTSNQLVVPAGSPVGTPAILVDSEYGWGVNGGVKINLPMLAAGDFILFAAAYSQGSLRYAGGNSFGGGGLTSIIGSLSTADGFVNARGDIEKTDAFAGTVQIRHNWTPTLRSDATFSYARVDYSNAATFINAAGIASGFVDFQTWQVGANLQWLPVRGLLIAGEVNYIFVDSDRRIADPNRVGFTTRDSDVFQARLRVQRDF